MSTNTLTRQHGHTVFRILSHENPWFLDSQPSLETVVYLLAVSSIRALEEADFGTSLTVSNYSSPLITLLRTLLRTLQRTLLITLLLRLE